MMQKLVGIVRLENEMQEALSGLKQLWERAKRVGVPGNREYNPGWHTSLDLAHLLTVSEAITLAAIERKESRGAQFREDYPDKSKDFSTFNIVIKKGPNGEMRVERLPLPPIPAEMQQIIDDEAKAK
jgi:succinate dehydrogenase / fumarate reductase, flavoprotein subunit